MAEQKANTDKAEAEARKASAEADKAEAEAKLMMQRVAAGHMDELRKIEGHSHEMARGHVAHHQNTAHAQDRHEVDMTHQGMDAAGKLAGLVQGAQSHDAAMNAPPETAEAEQ
jgi:pyruvate/2-oxoglutarate dehydrogenase complex dihydrolipoamide acyltransferase (E2) component